MQIGSVASEPVSSVASEPVGSGQLHSVGSVALCRVGSSRFVEELVSALERLAKAGQDRLGAVPREA